MALLDKNGVFDALCIAIPSISGLKVESADRLIGRILVKGGVSLASWGEGHLIWGKTGRILKTY